MFVREITMRKSLWRRKSSWKPLKRAKLPLGARVGRETTKELKTQIQAKLRAIRLILDGGCILRNYPETGACGGYRADGELICQFDHLNSRTHSISFADERLGVILCKRHHIFWKKQYPAQFEKIVRKIIGRERCKLLDRVRADYRPYKVDFKLETIRLDQLYQSLLFVS